MIIGLEKFPLCVQLTHYPAVGEKCIPGDLSDHVVNFLHKVMHCK